MCCNNRNWNNNWSNNRGCGCNNSNSGCGCSNPFLICCRSNFSQSILDINNFDNF